MGLNMNVLILPGIGNSGPQHWQSLWQAANPSFVRVAQRDWNHPVCSEWVASLESAVSVAGPNTVLVAHSLACLQVVHWAALSRLRIRGAFLVAVPDVENANFPAEAIGFTPLPQQGLPFSSIIVASTDDPFGSLAYAHRCETAWGNRLVTIEAAGHINAASGLGEWQEGFALLQTLILTTQA